MNILITGGAGFIGSNFLRHMLERYPNYRVINLDKLTFGGSLENIRDMEDNPNHIFIKGDICDKGLVEEIFKEYRPDGVIHFAAQSHVDRSILEPEEFLNTNILGTFTLIDAARKGWHRDKDRRRVFLNVSTDEVYGSIEEGSFKEDSTYAPNSPYSASKAGADHLVRAYYKTYGLPAITTHTTNNFGPYQMPEKLIPLVILNAVEGKELPIYGDGRNVRDWLYVLDHCTAIDAVFHRGRIGQVYNIGANNEWPNIEIVKLVCSILDELLPDSPHRPHEGLIRFVKDRPAHDRRYSIDPSKMMTELDWRPANRFEDALRDTVRWYLRNRTWCDRVRGEEYQKYYERNYSGR